MVSKPSKIRIYSRPRDSVVGHDRFPTVQKSSKSDVPTVQKSSKSDVPSETYRPWKPWKFEAINDEGRNSLHVAHATSHMPRNPMGPGRSIFHSGPISIRILRQ
ncbi:hypothetical protein AMTRI_Chr06g194770 [Amborella trichopoda]